MKNITKILFFFILCTILGCDNDEENHDINSELEGGVHTVFAGNFYYDPPNITINQGEQVRWINDGGLHDVNGEINSITNVPFDNPELFNSESTSVVGEEIYKHTFNIPGLYSYDCSVGGHANNGWFTTKYRW